MVLAAGCDGVETLKFKCGFGVGAAEGEIAPGVDGGSTGDMGGGLEMAWEARGGPVIHGCPHRHPIPNADLGGIFQGQHFEGGGGTHVAVTRRGWEIDPYFLGLRLTAFACRGGWLVGPHGGAI